MTGINILLDTFFNNPFLPVVTPLGFFDDFNRADGAIGVTRGECKPWRRFQALSGDASAVVSFNQAAPVGSSGACVYAVDAGSGDGDFSTVVMTVSTDGNSCLIATCLNYDNSLLLTLVSATGRPPGQKGSGRCHAGRRSFYHLHQYQRQALGVGVVRIPCFGLA